MRDALHRNGSDAAASECAYSWLLVSESIALAIGISLVALLLTCHFRNETKSWSLLKTLSAVLMGAAVPVMHYTGMAAVSFTASSMTRGELSHAASITDVGRESVILVTLVLGTTLLTVLLDCGKEEASSLDYFKEMTHPMTTRRPTQELPSCLAEPRYLRRDYH